MNVSAERVGTYLTVGVTFDVGKQTLVLWEVADEAFDGSSYLRYGESAHLSYNSKLPASSP